MRRAVAWGCAAALILALAACGFVRWPLPAAKVGDSLNAAFGASPRLHWSAPQAATFSVLPWPSLRVVDARLNDAYGVNLLSAPTARLDLSLVELMRGRFVPARAILVSPTVTLDIDRPPFAGAADGSAAPASVSWSSRAVGELEPFQWRGARRQQQAWAGHADRERPRPPRRAHHRRSTALRPVSGVAKRAVAILGALGDPEAAAKGAPSPFAIALDSPIAKFAFSGEARRRRHAKRRGRHDGVDQSDHRIDGSAQRRIAASSRARRPDHHGQGQGCAQRHHARRGDGDQRRADFRRRARNRRPQRAANGLGHARRRRVALAPLLGPPERLYDLAGGGARTFRARGAARLRPRLAPLGVPRRRLRPSALQRRRIGHRQGRQAEREPHRGRRV